MQDFKLDAKDNIGNVTCVLAKLKALDANLDINLEFYSNGLWNTVRKSTTLPVTSRG